MGRCGPALAGVNRIGREPDFRPEVPGDGRWSRLWIRLLESLSLIPVTVISYRDRVRDRPPHY